MRIMLDTNVFISIVVFGSKQLSTMLNKICKEHRLVLSSYILEELSAVINSKFPAKVSVIDNILFNMPFEIEFTPHILPKHDFFSIRDPKDEKILYSAITADVDILITGDRDFLDIEIKHPEILSPSEFIKRHISGSLIDDPPK